MAGVSAAWSFDRFFDERQSPPVKEEQGQPLQQQKGHGKEDGLEWGEEVCHAAEDATVKFMHIEQGVDEVGGQGGYASDRYRDERAVSEYDVTYEYAGRQYTTRTNYHPGDRIRVRVDVRAE